MDSNNLNKYQKKAYNEICKLFDENENSNVAIAIDTATGTGKTFLLSTLASVYPKSVVQFVVFRKDQASAFSSTDFDVYTYVSFIMHYFNLSYHSTIRMFDKFSEDGIQELYKLIVYSKKFVVQNVRSIILDTYTIPSPAMLILLYIISIKNRLNLIFAGSAMQLDAISKSMLHDESNFYIVQILTDLTINRLTTNMRIRDNTLQDKVSRFHKIIQQFKRVGNVQFHFNLRYSLYCLFRAKYFTEENFDTVYLAQTHRNIRLRLYRFTQYLQSIDKPFIEAPFYYSYKGGWKPLPTVRTGKFFPSLLLVEGYKYVYITEKGVHHIVQLERILNNQDTSLLISFINDDNHKEVIQRTELNYYQILPAYREWLLKNVIHTEQLKQFPLRPYTLTYHTTLGRTIDKDRVELSTECAYANYIYIGLCSVCHYWNIHKIHDERNLLNFVITEYMENVRNDNTYYYCCPFSEPNRNAILEYVNNKCPNSFIDSIEWLDVDTIEHFECKRPMAYLRIKRCIYKQSNDEVNTPLMQVAKFVKENPNVILNTLKMAPADNYTGYKKKNNNNNNDNSKKKKKKKKKKKNTQDENEENERLEAYVYLNKEYLQWADKNEE